VNKQTTLATMFQLREQYPVRVMFIGWPGILITDYAQQMEVRRLLLDKDCIPVFPSPNEFHLYSEFCNSFLWPACNNVVRSFQGDNPMPFDRDQWAAYQLVNQRYADVVISNVREASDIIWVHDFHLFLVPMHITRKLRKANIGFFLHTPFPSSEIFRCLPVREEILKGMLCADLVGFNFWEYARHFLTCCRRVLGLEFEFKRGGFVGIDYCSREVRVRVGHKCLQFDFTMDQLRQPVVIRKTDELMTKYGERFIYLGVDRMDRLSGLRLKFLAFQTFLERNPLLAHKVVLVQYVYPGVLQGGSEGEKLPMELEHIIEEIRNEFGPDVIEYYSGELDHPLKFAALRTADCLLDTSLKDGLNLVPFEYCAARLSLVRSLSSLEGGESSASANSLSSLADQYESNLSTGTGANSPSGVMVISEFSGCSRVLVGALKVNPWNTERLVESLLHAFNMATSEKRRHFAPDVNYVASHSLVKWATDFLADTREARKKDEMVYVAFGFGANTRLLGVDQNFGKLDPTDVAKAYKGSKVRLFLLDNEGTLAPDLRYNREHSASVTGHEQLSVQGCPPSASVLRILATLCQDPKNIVIITSGRQRGLLETWFTSVKGIGYAAEHGFTYKVPAVSGEEWRSMLPSGGESTVDMSWTSIAFQLMDLYRKRVQNTYIHFKGSAMVWQYREADPEVGAWQARELAAALEETLTSHHVVVSSGKGYVEVRIRGVNKGVCATTIIHELEASIGRPDFVLCIGDDRSDELMFEAVNDIMKPELQSSDDMGPPTPELCRARSGKSFADLNVCTPGMDIRRLPSGMKRTSSISGGGKSLGDNPLGAMDSARRCQVPPIFTCTVGKKPSKAKYYLNDVDEVSDLLQQIAQAM
jgi:trehalose 6-phosphate synthase/phosphatase